MTVTTITTLSPEAATSIRRASTPIAGYAVAGLVGGAVIGVVARGWMRLLTDEPEFTWSGSVFIVAAFTICGLGHGLAAGVRQATARRGWVAAARLVGALLTMPLFVGAGAMMLPTVVAGSLARWRTGWRRSARIVAALLALAAPVAIIVPSLTDGISLTRAAGLLLMVATYVAIIHTTRPIVAPRAGRRPVPRAARLIAIAAGLIALVAIAVSAVGIAAT